MWGCETDTQRGARGTVCGGSMETHKLDSWALSDWIGPANAGREADGVL